jgi:tetratricopeptide (TPR) repeat protein
VVALLLKLLPRITTYRKIMNRYLSLFTIYIIATGSAFGAGSRAGGGALKKEQGAQPVQIYNQGIQLMHAKKFAEAQVKFQQALSENPNFAEAHNNLAYSLRKQGPQNYAKALEHYDKAIQLKPDLAEAYEYRGVLFLKLGRKVDAEKDLATLKTLNPKLATELEHVIQTGNEEQ